MERIEKNTKKTFLSGVLLLTLSTVLVKVVGLIYKIPMLSYLGSEGMGYFNSAYEIYALFCVISTAGLPVALSVLISGALAKGQGNRIKRIYRVSLSVFLTIGIVGTAVMLLLAQRFCALIRSENAYYSILSIAPTVFFICVSSAIRGYFQGYQKMMPTAVSQILEAVGKLVFGLLFARMALLKGFDTPRVAAFAGLGLTLGTAVSVLYLLVEKARFCPAEEIIAKTNACGGAEECGQIRKTLARLAVPMTLGASLVSITKLIDMAMILRRLQSIGLDEVAANEAYGSYTTLALSVFGLLPTLVNAVALPLIPMLSAAIASHDLGRQAQIVKSSYRLTSIFALPASLGISAFAKPILMLLFASEPETVSVAAPLLSYLGISVFLSCMITATNSVLHAYQVVNRPILSMMAGAAVKIISSYLLIGIPSIALAGAPISSFLCNATVVLFNLYFAARLCPMNDLRSVFLKPMLTSTAAVGLSYLFYHLIALRIGEGAVLTLVSVLLAAVLYFIFSCLFGVLCEEDISALPCGDALYRFLQKIRLLPYHTLSESQSKMSMKG